jgi:CheY-like chemotaxis protein
VTTEPSPLPSFEAWLERGQEFLAQLAALHDGMAKELADRRAELSQTRSELGQTRALQRQLQQELDAMRKAQQALAAERERLLADIQALQTNRKAQEAQLAGLHEELEQLKELHTHVTTQAAKLAADWSARRLALAAENQRLAAEVKQARQTLVLGQEREKQWKAQVWKLQDDVGTLRGAAGRVTLTAEESHHLYTQLNAIIGFAEVLLDEAGDGATGAERQEFVQHIKDSGTQLADYVNRLMGATSEASASEEPVEAAMTVPIPPPGAPAVVVAATDAAMRERIEPFLNRAGYRVEFAGDRAQTLKMAVELKPLAIVIDTALPQGAEGLVDELLKEPRARDIPVVLAVKNDEEQLGLSLGQYDLLRKPITRQQVLQVMAKYDLLAERRRANKMPTSVLVIDDDPRNTRLVQAMLKPFSIEVLLAHDGAAGIKLARSRKPDLIILDLMMPDVDGFDVVSALRGDAATAQTPILIYTAKNITKDDRQRLQGNIQSIIRKGDFSKEQFLELVYRRGERRKPPSADEEAAA